MRRLRKLAKECGMAGRWNWALAIALACLGTQKAQAQTPQAQTPEAPGGQEKTDPAAAATLPMPAAAGTADLPVTPFAGAPIRSRLYADADYLLWWIRRGNLPEQPLVTTGVQTPANATTVGIVGQPGTQTLFGKNSLEWNIVSGANLTIGYNFSADESWGVEGRGFILPKQTINYNFSGTGTPLVTRPIFDNFNKLEGTYDVSSVDATGAPIVTGSLNILATTEFWGYELNLTRNVLCTTAPILTCIWAFVHWDWMRRFNFSRPASFSKRISSPSWAIQSTSATRSRPWTFSAPPIGSMERRSAAASTSNGDDWKPA